MLELTGNVLSFHFPEVHPEARVDVVFHRTLRIPDDGKVYPLPPNLGNYPVKHVDDHKDTVPEAWLEHGGVMLPMWQSEAMWLEFKAHYIPEHQGVSAKGIDTCKGVHSSNMQSLR